jgi:predicted transposase YdaD
MMEYDASYKTLFSHPEMVADLLRGFVPDPWVAQVDFSTLELVGGSYVSDDLRTREDDLVWRMRLRDEWVYVYLLLEFQSTVDPFMAVRLMTYLGLLYQDLIRRRDLAPGLRLPPVVPLVLYNGMARWQVALDIAELVWTGPVGLSIYRPQLRYLLIDEGALGEDALPATRNLAAALFRLEHSRQPEDVRRVVESLIQWLAAPEQTSLRRAFTVWLGRVLLPARLPGMKVPEVAELKEVRSMLAERVIEWTKDWKQQGIEAGRQEGLQMGLQEGLQMGRQEGLGGMRENVFTVLEVRFGATPLRIRESLERIGDLAKLKQLHRQAILAASLEEFAQVLATEGNGHRDN